MIRPTGELMRLIYERLGFANEEALNALPAEMREDLDCFLAHLQIVNASIGSPSPKEEE